MDECDLPQRQVHVEKTYIELLQITGFSNTKVIQIHTMENFLVTPSIQISKLKVN